LAIINPAAGGGRCGQRVGAALDQLRSAGISLEIVETRATAEASKIAREAYLEGRRKFLAIGGDGTAYEVVNGLFPAAQEQTAKNSTDYIPTLGLLPLGTGNSFLRDFQDLPSHESGLEHAMRALREKRSRPCDVLRLTHETGAIYYTNALSMGFAGDVAMLRHRRFQSLGQFGYLLAIFVCLAKLNRRPIPVRFAIDSTVQGDFDRRPCLFLTFNNSKFTGGTMMIAPDAITDDGLIEYVRWGPIGRVALIRNLPTLYDGTHTSHPLAEHHAVRESNLNSTPRSMWSWMAKFYLSNASL
jgi:Sphingosine kinase and enzymes related to eukaryotic diacylglycerol kinase